MRMMGIPQRAMQPNGPSVRVMGELVHEPSSQGDALFEILDAAGYGHLIQVVGGQS
jgi:hypothetical protein